MSACDSGDEYIVQLLLESSEDQKIDMNVRRSEYGKTTFMIACDSRDEDIVQLLLEYSEDRNINLNVRDDNGLTAFMLACRGGHKDVVQLLLKSSSATPSYCSGKWPYLVTLFGYHG